MARPTMHDVARHAGVSQKTVSNVLNGYPYIRAETRDRVLVAVDELGYQLNVSARILRTGRSGLIGLAVPDVQLPYFGELAASVIAAAEGHDWRVLIEQTGGLRHRELEVLAGSDQPLIEGMIFVPTTIGPADVTHLTDRHPFVLLNEPIFGDAADYVTMQHYAGARAATEHLISTGRRAIAVIGVHHEETEGSAADRLRGYRDALGAAGLQADDRRVFAAGLWHLREGAEAARRMLAADIEVDGVFCFNDTLALGALHALQSAGRSVPADIGLIGFDDIQESAYSTPSLSTVSPGREQMAQVAVDMLASRVRGGSVPEVETAGFHLIVRESTAPLR